MGALAQPAVFVPLLGFGLAFIFGYIANRSHFCTMGAISDIYNMRDWNRMRMWLMAIGVAVLGATALQLAGLVDLSKSIYLSANVRWLSNLVGGLCFGIGMTIASGCGQRTLVRIGGGNLKSLVVFVFIGISAYMTLKGLFGLFRATYLDPVALHLDFHHIASQDLPTLLHTALPVSVDTLRVALAALIGGGLLAFAFAGKEFRRNHGQVLAGLVVGLVIVAAWYVSGHLGYGEDPDSLEMTFFGTNSHAAESFSFIAPIAYSLELLMLWTDASLKVTFGIATVMGMVLGSLAYALVNHKFQWEGFRSIEDLKHHIIGGTLMGFGGVTGLGCTIGQGISGVSTLAIGSFLTLFSIIAGSLLAMKYLSWRLSRMPAAPEMATAPAAFAVGCDQSQN